MGQKYIAGLDPASENKEATIFEFDKFKNSGRLFLNGRNGIIPSTEYLKMCEKMEKEYARFQEYKNKGYLVLKQKPRQS